jgi:hypothetical protein
MTRSRLLIVFSLVCFHPLASAADASKKTYDDPANVDGDYAYQGEYLGEFESASGPTKLGIQVVALGGGKFYAHGYHGGLPGDWKRGGTSHDGKGELKDGVLRIDDDKFAAVIKPEEVSIENGEGQKLGTLKKVHRESPTLGAKPPSGAVVLFDGSGIEAFPGAKMSAEKLLLAGATSKQKFNDCTLHLEFRTPYQPGDSGQGRGNSGVYLQGRFEVQVLDSFGLVGKNNECGGIYSTREPDVNMCFPPLTWQTYDIDFTAAKFDGEKKIKPATITVKHNGVVIHENAEVNKTTTAAPVKDGPEPGPLYLQNHGNPVRYRNIWIVEKP